MTRVVLMRAVVVIVALVAGWAIASAAEPPKIRVGWAVVPANIGPLMVAKDGLAAHNGKSYTADFIHFAGAPQQLAALGANELDIASLAYSTFALGIENGGMTDLRVIADSFQDGVANYDINQYVVLRDGPIKKVEDLKGKVLATNGIGSSGDMAMRVMLGKHGLDPKRDVSIVEAAFPTMKAMLANAPMALGGCIEMVNRGYDLSIGDALAAEATAFGLLFSSEDKREGTRAFLEKRAPSFKGV